MIGNNAQRLPWGAGVSPACAAAGTAAPQKLTRAMRAAMAELAKALDYAQQARRTPWDFSVEIASLTALGLTASDLRWLVSQGCIEHARDISRPGDTARKFQRCENLAFARDTCFVLTEVGQHILEDEASGPMLRFSSPTSCVPFTPPNTRSTMGCRASRTVCRRGRD
ncbi:MAG: hypothetical protein WCJ35_23325 [Planctomycetota bacterium]